VLGAGCTDPVPPGKFVGDPKLPPEVQMLFTDGVSLTQSPVADGTEIPMENPPQGGFVVYIGAAARNLDIYNILVAGTLRDPASGSELAFDARNSTMVVGSDGWARTAADVSNTANVNTCPDYFDKDRVGGEFILEMRVTDRARRTAMVSHRVKLICDPALNPFFTALCQCVCSANYTFDKCQNVGVDM
jgi:hypothetical protein